MQRAHNLNAIKINCSINEIMRDLKNTSDPVKRAILQKFMDIKVREMRHDHHNKNRVHKNNNDLLIDILSESYSEPDSDSGGDPENNIENGNKINKKQNNVKKTNIQDNKNTKQEQINDIIKRQNQGLSDLDKINAYKKIIQENENEKGNKKPWNPGDKIGEAVNDPKYSKFLKEESMNNKLMERFTTEIDFKNDENKKMPIEKPFDEDYGDNIADTFARFEAPEEPVQKKRTIKSKKHFI